jgi:drug/metabolite transporter (DMT)-like permease
MSTAALALVLASAAIHALWNTLLAGAEDTHATSAVAMLAGAALFAPVAALTWDVDASAVPYILGSAALEVVYFALLATAYARAGLTFVYPVARGSAPVIVLVVSVVALGVALSAGQVLGVLAVVAGVLLVRGIGRADGGARTLALALGIGACIAGYTLVDDHGLRHAAALGYFEAVLVLAAIPYAAAVAARGGGGALRAAVRPRALVAGAGMFAAYALTLAALELAEAAPVAALRETSVVMATLAAAIAGRETVPRRRLAGAAVVVAGAAAIALS